MVSIAPVYAGWKVRVRQLLVAVCLTATGTAAIAEPVPLVAAASDLKFALDEAIETYRQHGGQVVRASYGSSGNFFAQIRQGAPFDIFMSADETLVLELARLGLARDDSQLYGIGRLALFVPHGSPLHADAKLDDLERALADGRLRHFAIANPAHAPYGRAARDALQARGLWPVIEARLVLGENVAQAAQFALTGAAEGGLIALSLARAPTFAAAGEYALVPAEMHQPLRQRMAALKRASPAALEFYAWLAGAQARDIFARFGFELPDE